MAVPHILAAEMQAPTDIDLRLACKLRLSHSRPADLWRRGRLAFSQEPVAPKGQRDESTPFQSSTGCRGRRLACGAGSGVVAGVAWPSESIPGEHGARKPNGVTTGQWCRGAGAGRGAHKPAKRGQIHDGRG